MSAHSISVVVPVYNHAQHLERSIGALAAQTCAPAEVIVLDDGSNDGSADVAQSLASRFPSEARYRVIRSQANRGVNAAMNLALEQVTSTWTCFTGADDWLEPCFVERMSQASEISPGQGIITSQYVEWFESDDMRVHHGPKSALGTWYLRDAMQAYSSVAYADLLEKGYVALQLNGSVLRTTALRELGGFDPELKWHADWFVATVLALRYGMTSVAEPLAVFRRSDTTFSGMNVRDHDRQRELFSHLFDKLRIAEYLHVRQQALKTPAMLAPFIRDVLPTLALRSQDRDLLFAVSMWWIGQFLRAQRPGLLLRLRQRLGMKVAPKI